MALHEPNLPAVALPFVSHDLARLMSSGSQSVTLDGTAIFLHFPWLRACSSAG